MRDQHMGRIGLRQEYERGALFDHGRLAPVSVSSITLYRR